MRLSIRDVGLIAVGFALLIGLSAWQWQRLGWKQDLLASIAAGLHRPPLTAPNAPALLPYYGYDLMVLINRSQCFRLQNQPNTAGELGNRCVCRAEFPKNGGSVALTFPWEKAGGEKIGGENTGLCSGESAGSGSAVPTALFAFALPAPKLNRFMPNNPPAGDWWWLDLANLPTRLGVESRGFQTQLYLQVASFNQTSGSWQLDRSLDLPNNHRQYALTWLLLAAAWLVMMTKARCNSCKTKDAPSCSTTPPATPPSNAV
jgi:surfeit locus 1 family protein